MIKFLCWIKSYGFDRGCSIFFILRINHLYNFSITMVYLFSLSLSFCYLFKIWVKKIWLANSNREKKQRETKSDQYGYHKIGWYQSLFSIASSTNPQSCIFLFGKFIHHVNHNSCIKHKQVVPFLFLFFSLKESTSLSVYSKTIRKTFDSKLF